MANTRDTIGENATLAGLVGNTLTELEEDSATSIGARALAENTALTTLRMSGTTTIGTYAFSGCTGLTEIPETAFPVATSLSTYAFRNCSNIVSASFPSLTSISANAFNGCSKLKHLILSGNTMCSLSNVSAFTGTPIAAGEGAVYVPTSLVDTYKASTNWSGFFIAPISSYPLSSFDTIQDSLETIMGYSASETLADHYSNGDTKTWEYNGVSQKFVLLDATEQVWCSKNILEQHRFHSSNANPDYATSELAGHIEDTMIPKFPTLVQNHMVNSERTYISYLDGTKSEKTITAKAWLLSGREVFGGTSYESSGAMYTGVFKDNSSRIKQYNGSANYWWLRSAISASIVYCVNSVGSAGNYGAAGSFGVVLGFKTR